MEKKLKFQSVVSLVIGSQIGSGIFLLPASLSLLGPISLFGWFISGAGAILLALVFARLSRLNVKGGGPHAYIEMAFGRRAGFFAAWTYWLVSWVSSIAVIIAAVSYLAPLLGVSDPLLILCMEIGIIIAITFLNLRGVGAAGSFEIFLTLLKCAPLVLIPLAGLFFLKPAHFSPLLPPQIDLVSSLKNATLMTFWGFVGLETAVSTSTSIENPTRTVPKAVVVGTTIVALIYMLNSIGIMGVISPEDLAKTSTPYADAASKIFGGAWYFAIALIAFIACIGTLNAWVLTSGQIAMDAAKEGLFPKSFAKTNGRGAPVFGLMVALGCTIPILVTTLTPNILQQLNGIIDLSVTAFMLIYLTSACALLKMALKGVIYKIIAVFAIGFCAWVLSSMSLQSFLICSLFALSGIPIYYWQKKRLVLQ